MNISLQNKTAIICGSTHGIGKAIAEAFAEAGATCILIARNAQALETVRTALATPHDQKHLAFVADFSEIAQVHKVIKQIAETATVEILINNTGGPKPGPITDVADSDFIKAFEQHIIVNQALVNGFMPAMKNAGYGRIINIVSTSVKIPLANLGASNTIRAAVAGWAKTLSNELGQFNITVNNILPGFTETARLDSLIQTMVTNTGKPKQEIVEKLQQEIPMKRFGQPAELGNLAVFLASPAASYITGTSIPVDGGRTGSL